MKFKKLSAILLSVFLTLSCLASCGDTSSNSSSSSSGSTNTAVEKPNAATHVNNSVATNKYVMRNSILDYTILVPENAADKEMLAAEEFITFFYEATKVRIDKTSVPVAGKKYISFGNTVLAEGVFDFDASFEEGGFRIKTVDDNIIVQGRKVKGTLNGAYHLLNLMFGFEYFYEDTWYIDTNVKDIVLYDYDVLEIPDVENNHSSNRWASSIELARYRQFTENKSLFRGHNEMEIVGGETVLAEHPKWLSKGDQSHLCYTARGDVAEYEAMKAATMETIIEGIKKSTDPEQTWIGINIEDTGGYCSCSECQRYIEDYGAISSTIVRFLNDLKGMLDAWEETEEGRPYQRDYTLSFYAYIAYIAAPVKVDPETGEKIAMMRCVDGVVPRYTNLHTSYHVPFDSEHIVTKTVEDWKLCADKVWMYWYNSNFHYYLAPYQTFNSIQYNYQMAYKWNTEYLYILSQHTQEGTAVTYQTLNMYLCSKLGWDSYIDMEYYINLFFKYHFADAADIMYTHFNEFRAWMLHLQKDFRGSSYGGIYSEPLETEYWPQKLLERWFDYFDQALETIEYLKETNPAEYTRLYKHIITERISYQFLYVEIYKDYLPDTLILDMKRQVKSDCEYVGLSRYHESKSLSSLWTSWGIA